MFGFLFLFFVFWILFFGFLISEDASAYRTNTGMSWHNYMNGLISIARGKFCALRATYRARNIQKRIRNLTQAITVIRPVFRKPAILKCQTGLSFKFKKF